MFEDIDEITIQNANNTIKELYEKFQDPSLLSIISKEEILERDFDNMFIFEDFFSDFLEENRDVPNFRNTLIEDIVDTIEANYGDITILELYDILTKVPENVILVKEDEKHNFLGDKPLKSNFEIVYGNNHRINVTDINDYEKFIKKSDNDIKVDNVNSMLLLKPSRKYSKSKIEINNEKESEGIKEWSSYKKNK